jgi:hypothetical protein
MFFICCGETGFVRRIVEYPAKVWLPFDPILRRRLPAAMCLTLPQWAILRREIGYPGTPFASARPSSLSRTQGIAPPNTAMGGFLLGDFQR